MTTQPDVFAHLEPTDREALYGAGTPLALPSGAIVYHEGDTYRREVFLIESGELTVTRERREPEQPPPGYLLGVSSYLSEAPYAATVTAVGDVRLRRIRHEQLVRLEAKHPAIADAMSRLIGTRLHRARISLKSGTLSGTVRSVMSAPLLRAEPDDSVAGALKKMLDARIGSIVIDADRAQIMSFEDAARCLASRELPASQVTAAQAARIIPTIDANARLWQAQELQIRSQSKYLMVTDGGRAVGVIAQSDIIASLAAHRSAFTARVAGVGSVDELKPLYESIHQLAAELLESNRRASSALRALSNAHLAIQQRAIELTLNDLRDEGHASAPGPFAFIIMGSGGRREMMLDPDQDNGLILHNDFARDDGAKAWFMRFAERVNENLDRAGYVLCPGDIMARNPTFHKTLDQWRAQVDHMSTRPNEKAARWSSIAFDFDTQYGDPTLAGELRNHVNSSLKEHHRLLQFMVADDAQGRAPINWFNRLIATGEKDGHEVVDIKRNGLRIVANGARILALGAGLHATNTGDRFRDLTRSGVVSHDFAASVLDAYDELLAIALGHQIRQRRSGLTPDKQVAPEALAPPEREALRIAMRAVKRLQEKVQDEIGTPYA